MRTCIRKGSPVALREHSRPALPGRTGRHGRPGPFGGRLRLPTIRFSGAAMAMSTVVGISLATTWLLNEQQQIGRRVGVTVGGPPAPSPDASDATPTAASGTASALPADLPSPSPSHSPSSAPSRSGGNGTGVHPARATTAPSASSFPSVPPARTTAPPPAAAASSPAPAPSVPAPSGSAPALGPARTLSGTARVDALGRSGTRHTLRLDLTESMTALQVEFRLNLPTALPGTVPATDLPGAVATIALERDTLVYRFTTPPDLPLPPGSYTFTVTGAIAAPSPAVPETWTASAFALPTSRALTTRGTF